MTMLIRISNQLFHNTLEICKFISVFPLVNCWYCVPFICTRNKSAYHFFIVYFLHIVASLCDDHMLAHGYFLFNLVQFRVVDISLGQLQSNCYKPFLFFDTTVSLDQFNSFAGCTSFFHMNPFCSHKTQSNRKCFISFLSEICVISYPLAINFA